MKLINFQFTTLKELNTLILRFKNNQNLLIQIFCGNNDIKLIQEIITLLSKNLKNSSIIGTSTAGEISSGKIYSNTILISFTSFEHTKLNTFYYSKANYKQGLKASEEIIKNDTKACILFSEALNNDAESFIDAFSIKDNILIAGGNAADNNLFTQTFIILNNKIYFDGIVIVSLNSKVLEVTSDYALNWTAIGKNMEITKCTNNTIYEIDNKKVKDVYTHYLGEEVVNNITTSAIEFPLIRTEGSTKIARSIVAKTSENAYIYAGHFKEGDIVKFAVGNKKEILQNSSNLQNRILENPSEVIFIYSCSVRKLFLDKDLEYEMKLINEVSNSCGFFTYGEFYTSNNKNSLLNISTTTLSLSENKNKNISLPIKHETYIPNNLSSLTHLINTIQNELDENIDFLEQYKHALDESTIVSKTDKNGVITYVNKNFCKISGYSKKELIGSSHKIIKHPDNQKEIFKDLWKTIKNGKTWNGNYKNINKNNQEYFVKATMIPLFDKRGNIFEYISIRTDITDIYLKDKIIKENLIDKLTGIKNRQALINLCEREEKQYILVLINIDRFSEINDYFGYDIADKLLILFTNELKKLFNNNIYRIIGDEFAVICNDSKDYKIFKNTIEDKLIKLAKKAYIINNITITVSTSAGMAYAKGKEIYTFSHIALKEAKETHKKLIYYNNEKYLKEKIKNNIIMISKIKTAIKNDKIVPYFQAIIDNKSKKVSKYESLMRLIDEDGAIISPYFFLEHAKKAKLYHALTKIMVEKTFKKFCNLKYEFSINLTIQDILSLKTREYLYSKLVEYNCGKRLVIEIVESEGIENFEEIVLFINKLKEFGCKIAIDDFGSGYSNFSYLAKLKVDYIKIDGSLIKNIHKDEYQKTTVESILLFAKKQNIKTIAEFVENEEIFNELLLLDIDYSQGYYFSKPSSELLEN